MSGLVEPSPTCKGVWEMQCLHSRFCGTGTEWVSLDNLPQSSWAIHHPCIELQLCGLSGSQGPKRSKVCSLPLSQDWAENKTYTFKITDQTCAECQWVTDTAKTMDSVGCGLWRAAVVSEQRGSLKWTLKHGWALASCQRGRGERALLPVVVSPRVVLLSH